MSIYIIFGGMKATLANQVIQALFLFTTMIVLTVMAYFIVGKGSFTGVLGQAQHVVPPDAVGDALAAEFRKDPAAARAKWTQQLEAARAGAGQGAEPAAVAKAEEAAYVKAAYKDIAASIKGQTADQAITSVRERLPDAASAMTIGVKTSSTLAMISTVIALVFGTAGLPHILIMCPARGRRRRASRSASWRWDCSIWRRSSSVSCCSGRSIRC
jgi:Na+(H+)/acetate symporter ActP